MSIDHCLRKTLVASLSVVFSLAAALVLAQSPPPTNLNPWLGGTRGVVVDESGQPVVGALVTWSGAGSGSRDFFQATTDQEGRYRFDGPVLSYFNDLEIACPGYVYYTGMVVSDEEQTIQLQKGKSISGRVVDANGEGIAGVSVSPFAYRRNIAKRQEPWVAVTDAEGRFSLNHATAETGCMLRLHKPGVIYQRLSWADESVPIPHESNRHSMLEFARGNFTFQVDGKCRTKLEVVDARNGQAVEISRVGIKKHFGRPPRLDQNLIRFLNLADPQADYPFTNLAVDTWRIFVFPHEDAELMGGFVDVTVQAETMEVNPRIELRAGRILSGKVVESRSGEPVANATIRYFPDDMQQIEDLGVVPDLEVRTDATGQFSLRVPEIDGELRLDQKVPGYVTLSDWDEAADEFRQSFTYKITAESIPTGISFNLDPAPVASFRVLDENGNPAPGVSFAGTHARNGRLSLAEWGVADEQGEFELRQLFDDCNYDYIRPDAIESGVVRNGVPDPAIVFQNMVFCWDPRNATCAVIRVVPDDLKSGERIEIRLQDGQTATGRIIDQVSGEPIENAIVKIRSPFVFRWETRTNVDGEFVVTGLFPSLDYHVTPYETGLEFPTRPFRVAESETSVDLEEIKVIDRNSQALEFAVPAVGGLEVDDALKKLVEFAEEQLVNAPERDRTFNSTRSRYLYRLTKAMDGQVNDLLKRTTNSRQGAAQRIALLKSVEYSAIMAMDWSNRVGWIEDSMQFLAENIDEAGVFDEFRHLIRQVANSRYHNVILEHSANPQIRGWAYLKMLNQRSYAVAVRCRDSEITDGGITDAEFDARLQQLEEFWKLGLDELGEVEVPLDGVAAGLQQVKEAVVGSMNRALLTTETLGEIDETRVEKLKALCERLKPR